MNRTATCRLVVCALALLAGGLAAVASDGDNLCDVPGEAPDARVGDLAGPVSRIATVGAVSAYSIGSQDCNTGSCGLNYVANTAAHPVFTLNLYRLESGRFEQVAMGWAANRFFALSSAFCETGCIPTDGSKLGVHCSSSDTATFNAFQQYLGPRSQVNAATGQFPHPITAPPVVDGLSRRMQVAHAEIDAAGHPGAQYFIEGQMVAADDAGAGNSEDNLTYRRVQFVGNPPNGATVGTSVVGQSALAAWKTADPGVKLETIEVAGDGTFEVASRATDLGGGIWHYEYAVHNVDSHRSAASVDVPLPAGVGATALGFHDVAYHSGEPYDGTDWSASVGSSVVWETSSFAVDPNANALRWGTLYNFRFDAAAPPGDGALTIGLFRPGLLASVLVPAVVPMLCEVGNGPDVDGDLYVACEDCNDANPVAWSVPGAVSDLMLGRGAHDATLLSWAAPAEPGANSWSYEVVRASGPTGTEAMVCLDLPDPTATSAIDDEALAPGGLHVYRVRAVNTCPDGVGPLGGASEFSCPD